MKKSEKTRQTQEKIIHAAVIEFGTKSYESASINSICSTYQISKGLIYHNFKNKDDLYLCCVKLCFQKMLEALSDCDFQSDTIEGSIQKLLQMRQKFFRENSYHKTIFFNVLLQPPVHLQSELQKIREEFDAYNKEYYRKLLSKVPLRSGITTDMAIEYFIIFQDMFNGYYQGKTHEDDDFLTLIDDHEFMIPKLLDLLLYGMIKKQEKEG